MVKEKKLSKKRRKQITRNAKRAAQKQIRKYGSVTKPLKVQVAATWKRLVGIVLLWFAYSAFVWDGGALVLLLTVVFGLLGPLQLHRVLTQPIYHGMVQHKGELFEGEHEAIIDDKLWDRVQTKLRDKQPDFQKGEDLQDLSTTKLQHPLKGFIYTDDGFALTPIFTSKKVKQSRSSPTIRLHGSVTATTCHKEQLVRDIISPRSKPSMLLL